MLTSTPTQHAASPLHQRLIVADFPESDEGRRAIARAVRQDGVAAATTHGILGWPLLELLSGWKENHHEGTGAMLGQADYARLLRRLFDEVLACGLSANTRVIVDVSAPTAERSEALRALYPDAVVVSEPRALRKAVKAALKLGEPERRANDLTPRLGEGNLIVVVACARSGTTWLQTLLMAHPDAGGIEQAETFVFHDLRKLWRMLVRGPYAEGTGIGEVTAIVRRHCDALLGATLARRPPGGTHFIEKTPLHAYLLPMINTIYPDAAVIHLVRDGRDVARSLSEVEFFEGLTVREGAKLWRDVVTRVREDSGQIARFREVRYEDLVADPTGRVGELMEWLGLRVDDSVTKEVKARAGRRVSVHGTSGAVGSGKWSGLDPAELAAIYDEAGDLLVDEWPHPSRPTKDGEQG